MVFNWNLPVALKSLPKLLQQILLILGPTSCQSNRDQNKKRNPKDEPVVLVVPSVQLLLREPVKEHSILNHSRLSRLDLFVGEWIAEWQPLILPTRVTMIIPIVLLAIRATVTHFLAHATALAQPHVSLAVIASLQRPVSFPSTQWKSQKPPKAAR